MSWGYKLEVLKYTMPVNQGQKQGDQKVLKLSVNPKDWRNIKQASSLYTEAKPHQRQERLFGVERQLIKVATHRMHIGMATHQIPFRGGTSSKNITHKSPTFDEWPPQWQITECPLSAPIHQTYYKSFIHPVLCPFNEWAFSPVSFIKNWNTNSKQKKKAQLPSCPDLT